MPGRNPRPAAGSPIAFYSGFVLLLLFAAILRFHHIGYESLYMDEVRQVSYYPHSVTRIVLEAASNQQPPLDFLIGHFIWFFSRSDAAVRMPAALFGIGAILLLVILVARICSWPVAFGTGLLAAVLPYHIYFSQEARPYSIVIFFLLGLIWSLDRFLAGGPGRGKGWAGFLLLWFFATCFLLSRTVSPVVLLTVLSCLLAGEWVLARRCRVKGGGSGQSGQLGLALVAFGFALLIYLPFLWIVLSASRRFLANGTAGFGISTIAAGIRNFDPLLIWQAFVVQLDPLAMPVLILLFLVPLSMYVSPRLRTSRLLTRLVLLLPCTVILHVFVMQAKAPYFFRAPYATYMFPLCLILAAASFQGLWDGTAKLSRAGPARAVLLLAFFCAVAWATAATVTMKSVRKKTDWQGLAGYISSSLDRNKLVFFDSLYPYGGWEPTYYGFSRYYRGGAAHLSSIRDIPRLAPALARAALEPVIVLFQRREYYLTPDSSYPFVPFSGQESHAVDYGLARAEPGLLIDHFVGFTVVRPARPSGNLALDTYRMLKKMLPALPLDATTVELYLAVAGLEKGLGLPGWEKTMEMVAPLVPPGEQERFAATRALIAGLPAPAGAGETQGAPGAGGSGRPRGPGPAATKK
ncbi:MAG: glycosyltransferase family 39 protein [Desulfobacterales bacterium]|nr:glycosyltransferase family 39 protein [Desulfobacterales bacterium]